MTRNAIRNLTATAALLLATSVGATACSGSAGAEAADPPVQRVEIEASGRGFIPGTIELKAGVPTELVFTRTTPSGCLSAVMIPAFEVPRTELPQGEAVTIRFTPEEPGTYEFTCWMNMVRGTIVVRSS